MKANEKNFAGFSEFKILLKPDLHDVLGFIGSFDRVDLLLPNTIEINELVAARSKIARDKAMEIEEEERLKKKIRKNEEASGLKAQSLDEKASAGLPSEMVSDNNHRYVQIITSEQINQLKDKISLLIDHKQESRDKYILNNLHKLGKFRQIASENELYSALDALNAIAYEQPHFLEVINFIKGFISLAIAGQKPFSIPPLLIFGPPGIGKTHFTKSVAKAMNRQVITHSFDSEHTASALTGSARHWANTKTGIVFDSVCMQKRADPIILLDEIDKASQSLDRDPLSPLHGLLEPLTAKSATDISIELEFDASHVFWVATANEKSRVSETILSRFKVFNIENPTAEQSLSIAKSTAACVQNKFNFMEYPGREIITSVAYLTPREQIKVLEQAFATAILAGRKFIRVSDIEEGVSQGSTLLH